MKTRPVYVIDKRGERTFWTKVGVAIERPDGSLTIKAESPADELHVRPPASALTTTGTVSGSFAVELELPIAGYQIVRSGETFDLDLRIRRVPQDAIGLLNEGIRRGRAKLVLGGGK